MTEAEFIQLVKEGNAEQVKAAVTHHPSLARAKDEGVSAIMTAVYYGKRDVARAIAEEKDDLDIHEAAALGDRHELVQILSANPQAHELWSADGFSPLALAAFFGHREMVQDLLKAGANPNVQVKNPLGVRPLHAALANQHKEIARDLIDSGSDVNAASGEGWTPLHYTAHYGDIETTKLLLEKGARSTEKKSDGKVPAELAREEGHTDLERLLTGAGGKG